MCQKTAILANFNENAPLQKKLMNKSLFQVDDFFKAACLFEASLILVALILGGLANINPFASLQFSSTALVLGVIGTLPLFLMFLALEKLQGFDDIYIDTPPILNFYSQSALIAAQKCLIPFDCDTFAREALYTLMHAIAEVRADHNQSLEVEGIIVNQYQKQANLPRQLVEELIAEGLPVLTSMISPSVKVRESHSVSQPLVHYKPYHKLTDEFRALYAEIQSK